MLKGENKALGWREGGPDFRGRGHFSLSLLPIKFFKGL